MLFDVQRHQREGWTVLAVVGELDLAAAPRVRQVALRAVPPPAGAEPPRVAVDLSGTDFLDSAGLGVVLGIVRRARQAGGRAVVVLQPGSAAARLFGVLGLDRVVAVAPDLDTALARADDPVLVADGGAHDG